MNLQTRLPALVLALPLLLAANLALALEVKMFNAAELQSLQNAGKPVGLHFHADWCPTCRAQSLSLQELKADAQLRGYTVLIANYDNERELKKRLNVRAQSTLVVFKGMQETVRIGGQTRPEQLKAALLTAR